MTTRRSFMTGAAAVAGTAALGSAHIYAQEPKKITWRLQTYAGPALGEHVIKPSIEAFNKAADGAMEIKLYYADQLVRSEERRVGKAGRARRRRRHHKQEAT